MPPSKQLLRATTMGIRSYSRIRSRCVQCSYSTASTSSITTAPEPPLLAKIRSDLKDALKEKDTNRLNVVRGILAEIVSFSKVNKPVTTDAQLVALLKSRTKLSKSAAADFNANQRDDLKDNEEAQIAVLEEYINSVEKVSEKKLTELADEVANRLEAIGVKLHMGSLIKGVLFAVEGRPVEMANVTRIVRNTLIKRHRES